MRTPLMDCHVHLDEINVYDPESARRRGVEPGEVVHGWVPVEEHARHIIENGLDTVFAIYEEPAKVLELRKAVPNCDVRGAFWPRDVSDPSLAEKCDSLYEKGLFQALKVHPVLDNFDLTTKNIENVLAIAREYDVPILYHSDDRPGTMELTSPEKQEALVRENGDVTFIIGHGGAYAHPRLVGNSRAAKGYWNGKNPRRKLVEAALELADENANVYYDVSVCTNKVKAEMITEFIHEHPEVAEKILIGTDFPIRRSSARSQLKALEKAGLEPQYLEKIASNRIIAMTPINCGFVKKWEANYNEGDDDDYHELIERVKENVSTNGTLDKDTVRKIYHWKAARAIDSVQWDNFGIYEKCFREILQDSCDDERKIELLDDLPGIGIPVASTILHFIDPDRFPIVDFRTVEALQHFRCLDTDKKLHYFRNTPEGYGVFKKTVAGIKDKIAQRNSECSLRRIDKALFAYHKTELNA